MAFKDIIKVKRPLFKKLVNLEEMFVTKLLFNVLGS